MKEPDIEIRNVHLNPLNIPITYNLKEVLKVSKRKFCKVHDFQLLFYH